MLRNHMYKTYFEPSNSSQKDRNHANKIFSSDFSRNYSILTCLSSVQMILTGHLLLKINKMIELFNDHGKNGQIFNGVLNIFLNKQLWWLSRSTFFALWSSASCLHSDVESVRGLKRLLSRFWRV